MMNKIDSVVIHRSRGKLEVYLFNVGQGDHIMIRFPGGQYGIIDFYYDSNNHMPEAPILSYFKDLKVKLPKDEFDKITIAFCCISHSDIDHVKGFPPTIQWFYEKGLLIEDFWLGAARNEPELIHMFKTKVESVVEKLPPDQYWPLYDNIGIYDSATSMFFEYFDKWKKRNFNNKRYKIESLGEGEYISNIRSLRKPCPEHNIKAISMGPLDHQIGKYISSTNANIQLKILGADVELDINENIISHILRLQYGTTNLLFGGDAPRNIWEGCLDRYDNPNYSYREEHGDYASRFIKVSHHGSKESSSIKIWNRVIAKNDTDTVCLGISAGQHQGFKHPDAETLEEIRTCSKDAKVYATNVCNKCIVDSSQEKEYHFWYDDFVQSEKYYGKKEPELHDIEINDELRKNYQEGVKEPESFGLLAYIFEIPETEGKKINTRIAVSGLLRKETCFYKEHLHKLYQDCDN